MWKKFLFPSTLHWNWELWELSGSGAAVIHLIFHMYISFWECGVFFSSVFSYSLVGGDLQPYPLLPIMQHLCSFDFNPLFRFQALSYQILCQSYKVYGVSLPQFHVSVINCTMQLQLRELHLLKATGTHMLNWLILKRFTTKIIWKKRM